MLHIQASLVENQCNNQINKQSALLLLQLFFFILNIRIFLNLYAANQRSIFQRSTNVKKKKKKIEFKGPMCHI